MKRQVFLLLVLAGVACSGAAAATGEDHVALVKSVGGTVHVVREQDRFDATPGARLLVADQLVSAGQSFASIVFRDGSSLTLGPAADLRVRDYVFEPEDAKYAFSVYLAKGAAIYSSGKIAKLAPEAVRIDAPAATVGVRGTRLLIEAR